jgi:hypothetical protein
MSFCEFWIKILIKHPSKYKILRSKTVEEVSRRDEREDMTRPFQSNVLLFYAVKNGLKTSKDNSFKSSFTKPNF